MGIRLEYDMHGHLKSKTPIARSVGTTVILTDLFHSYPVRLLEFKRNIKRDYNNALSLIHAYALISTNIRIVAINQPSKGSRSRVIATNGNANLRDNITNVFGAKMVTQIMPFEIEIKEKTDLDTESHGKIIGFISKPQFGVGRRSTDRQYFFINGRPCQLPKISKAFNELYRNFISNQYPCVIANFIIPTDSYDVNVTPDKRTILLHKEYLISDTIITGLAEQMEPSRSTFELNSLLSENTETSIQTSSSSLSSSSSSVDINYNRGTRAIITRQFDSFTHSAGKAFRPSTSKSSSSSSSSSSSFSTSSNGSSSKRPATNNLLNYVKRSKPTTEKSIIHLMNSSDKTTKEEIIKEDDNNNMDNDIKELDELDSDITPNTNDEIESISTTATVLDDNDNDNDNVIDNSLPKEKTNTLRGLWNTIDERISIQLALSQLGKLTKKLPMDNENKDIHNTNNNNNNNNKDDDDDDDDTNINSLSTSLKQASLNTDDNEIATKALSRVINKNDFSKIEVLGQFNNGFIIGLLDNDDIFIIDQHAADEKYNFETLQKSTRIKGQQLFKPQNLELTAPEELLVMDNVDIFRANGFDIKIDDQGEPTKRIFIISQPFSKNTMLDKKDISELVHLINERPGEMVRCSRIRGMFASRACRKSVMIGDSLNKSQMIKIIRNMGKIDQPWNCPHGRPTMRHLMTLKDLKHNAQNHQRQMTWKGSLLN
ncbi:unnamed protein product [Cunninghamella echinulata]